MTMLGHAQIAREGTAGIDVIGIVDSVHQCNATDQCLHDLFSYRLNPTAASITLACYVLSQQLSVHRVHGALPIWFATTDQLLARAGVRWHQKE
jgi:hypothetical protein